MSESSALVAKLWNYCHVLRDDGVSTIEYVEQLTYLLFLKMADERAKAGMGQVVPAGLDWQSLMDRDGDDLEVHYRHVLSELGRSPGTLGTIYRKAQNRIQDPAKLRRLVVNLINEETWTAVDADLKGDAYEGLLQKGAEDTKSGAGQYFTPRPLIRAMMACLSPKPGETIADPAVGTGGFLLAAHEWVVDHHIEAMDVDDKRFLRDETVHGWEIVDGTARLCAMNLLLHGIGTPTGPSLVTVVDALRADPGVRFDMVAANPPFGRKSSMTMVNEAGEVQREDLVIVRDDFWASTSNKQLNFLQHIKTMLKVNGRAAVVLPDNVLFEAGAGETIRRRLMAECDLHTILRLPTGIFYAQGVKANVLFFDRKPAAADAWTKDVWVYDLRTNMHFTLKTKPLRESDLGGFVAAYSPGDRSKRVESERFRRFGYDEVISRDKANLDITWLRDDTLDDGSTLPPPAVLAAEIVEELEAALAQFTQLAAILPTGLGLSD
ncbi:MAG: type I restriction-modification system subunit M [Candidatus Nanopelagicales bacterium]|jgi:type I restriction enzyme M protein|nr:type I restriction-modification system subunit M [Candidatus Nanopelagicales bacterium]